MKQHYLKIFKVSSPKCGDDCMDRFVMGKQMLGQLHLDQ